MKWPLVDLESDNNIGSLLFDIENVENRFTELMETTNFHHQIFLLRKSKVIRCHDCYWKLRRSFFE